MAEYSVYIDEAGDLGFGRGTRWFIITAVIVDKKDEPSIRAKLSQIKNRLNVKSIHFRELHDFNKKSFIVREIKNENFTYINVIADTSLLEKRKIKSASIAYNFICRILIERVSWFLREKNKTGDVILSSRGTSKDAELICYIKEKLIPYSGNQIAPVFGKVTAKPSGSYDLLQLADICATTTFLAYEINGWGFRTPCFLKQIKSHIYRYNGKVDGYGLKYFRDNMKPDAESLKSEWVCK